MDCANNWPGQSDFEKPNKQTHRFFDGQTNQVFNERIDERNECLLNNRVSRITDDNNRWAIDSGATTHCTGDRELFESPNVSYEGILGTASNSGRIEGIGTAKALLAKGFARLGSVICAYHARKPPFNHRPRSERNL